MIRPWQRRQEHLKQAAEECIEALAGTLAAHVPDLTEAEARYLAAVETWARGEMGARGLADTYRALGYPCCCNLRDIQADVGAHPTHLAGRVLGALRYANSRGAPPIETLRDTYEARRRECLRASLAAAMAAPITPPEPR